MISTQHQNRIGIKQFDWIEKIGCYIGYTPYIGVVSRFWRYPDGRRYIVAYGKGIDGDIAAVKTLINAQSLFLTEGSSSYNEYTIIIDNFDITGISVMDLFHNQNKRFLITKNEA